MTGWHATYRVTNPAIPEGKRGRYSWQEVPVAYWEDGYGWVSVASHQKRPGHLMRADEVRFANWEFQGYYPGRKVIAALPGAGWSAKFADDDDDASDDGASSNIPLVAWVVFDDGEVKPVWMGVDGYGDDPCSFGNFVCLVPPGGEVPDEA